MVFKRAENVFDAELGEWFTFPRSTLENIKHQKHGHVGLVCPDCGRHITVSSAIHTISDNGTVSPSMVCPTNNNGCFHEFISLEGW